MALSQGFLSAKNAELGDTSIDATYCEPCTDLGGPSALAARPSTALQLFGAPCLRSAAANIALPTAAYTYQAACGVLGSILAAGLVQWGRGGRKFAMAFFTVGAGVSDGSLVAGSGGRH